MGSDHSELMKSFPDEPAPTKADGEGNGEQIAAENYNIQAEDDKKDTADEEDSSVHEKLADEEYPSSDKPAGQVNADQTEDTVTNSNNENTTNEQIKEDKQDNQDPQEEGSKDLPSTIEDNGVSLEQVMEDSLQLVSHVC